LRAAGVAHVGYVNSPAHPARQLPYQKSVYVAEEQLSGFSCSPNSRNIFQQPANFESAEIGRERKAGLFTKAVLAALLRKFCNRIVHSRVLPYQRVVYGAAGPGIPDNGRLPLVGDAYRRKIGRPQSLGLHGLVDHFARAPPDFIGIVLDPSRPGENLFVLLLGN
jgi:hypothetical protein